jgi:DNA recombination protein RmuC
MDFALIIVAIVLLLAGVALLAYLALARREPPGPPIEDRVHARLAELLREYERGVREEFAQNRGESLASSRQLRDEVARSMRDTTDALGSSLTTLVGSLTQVGAAQRQQLDQFAERLGDLTRQTELKLGGVRETLESRLAHLQDDNAKRLELMRATVDEKLQGTLERRLGESFKLVSDRLEQVHKGLGEMQSLASGVGALQRVLTNVKTRGTWGEVQLRALLEQVLAPEQYAENVATVPGSSERVEFAVRLPGASGGLGGNAGSAGLFGDEAVWIPIDAKFPLEDYQRLTEAAERAEAEGVELAGKQLEGRLRQFAREIRDKYVAPPHTTDFAILYLPTEGLYAEVLRRPGLSEQLQREFRVNLAGPTTLWAILNSLQMGFRTLAIQRRSSEVWAVLGAVKTEFSKFAEVLDKVQKKLEEASKTIDQTGVRTRAIERKLREVEALPTAETRALLDDAALLEPKPGSGAISA